jgi:hypothetical protein
MALREVLDEGAALDEIDLLAIENYCCILQMAYLRWKWDQRKMAA